VRTHCECKYSRSIACEVIASASFQLPLISLSKLCKTGSKKALYTGIHLYWRTKILTLSSELKKKEKKSPSYSVMGCACFIQISCKIIDELLLYKVCHHQQHTTKSQFLLFTKTTFLYTTVGIENRFSIQLKVIVVARLNAVHDKMKIKINNNNNNNNNNSQIMPAQIELKLLYYTKFLHPTIYVKVRSG
jgi:hypothetical protein